MTTWFSVGVIEELIQGLSSVRDRCLKTEGLFPAEIAKVDADYRASARNLMHYMGLRHYDLRDLQQQLLSFGLSSLGRMEANTLAGLDAVLRVLYKLNRRKADAGAQTVAPVDFESGPALLAAHSDSLLGPAPNGRDVRVMVTMPSEAATDYKLILDLLAAGMDVMRINCAHDDVKAWERGVDHVRRAGR